MVNLAALAQGMGPHSGTILMRHNTHSFPVLPRSRTSPFVQQASEFSSIAYFIYSVVIVPPQVALYKNLYDDLLKEEVALVNKVDGLKAELSKAKVEAF